MWASTKLPCKNLLTKLCRAPMAADRLGRFLMSTTCPCPFYHHPSLPVTLPSMWRLPPCASCPRPSECSCRRTASSLRAPKGLACSLCPMSPPPLVNSICSTRHLSFGNVPVNCPHVHLCCANSPLAATTTWSGPMHRHILCLYGRCGPTCGHLSLPGSHSRRQSGAKVCAGDVALCRPTGNWPG